MVFDYVYLIMKGISTAISIVRVEMGLNRAYRDDVDNIDIHFAASSNDGTPLPRLGSGKYKLLVFY